MKADVRRLWYILVLVIVLALWLALGGFDAIEAPYVGF